MLTVARAVGACVGILAVGWIAYEISRPLTDQEKIAKKYKQSVSHYMSNCRARRGNFSTGLTPTFGHTELECWRTPFMRSPQLQFRVVINEQGDVVQATEDNLMGKLKKMIHPTKGVDK